LRLGQVIRAKMHMLASSVLPNARFRHIVRATYIHGSDQMKKLMAAALALSMLPLVSACNTVEGVGRDVQAGGEIVSETARDVKDKMSK